MIPLNGFQGQGQLDLGADLQLRYDGGDDTLFHLLEIDRAAL